MARKRKLESTKNLLDLYLYAAGVSEVPQRYHLWSFLSLIGATLGGRVWFEKFKGDRIYCNLYTMLIGPSGNGKDQAIKFAQSFAKALPSITRYEGKITGAGMADLFSLSHTRRGPGGEVVGLDDPCPMCYLITPEMSMSVGEGGVARDLIKRLTAWYSKPLDPYDERTRTNGAIEFLIPILSWLAGSTEDWLVESMSLADIKGGALGRVATIFEDYNLSLRHTDPIFPHDRDEVVEYISRRLERISRLEGTLSLSPAATEIRDRWYQTRLAPTDRALIPTWKREDDFAWKIAGILTVIAGRNNLIIPGAEMRQAQVLVASAHSDIPTLIQFASRTKESKGVDLVAEFIRAAGAAEIAHSSLLKKVNHYGMNAWEMRNVLENLCQRQDIEVRKEGRSTFYKWSMGKRGVLKRAKEKAE